MSSDNVQSIIKNDVNELVSAVQHQAGTQYSAVE